MPILRLNDKIVYFAHVPKCAGTSVEAYVEQRFGPLSFLDRKHFGVGSHRHWNRTSPQHIPVAALSRLFSPNFFDASFAVVRHPADRIVSAFRFGKEVSGRMPRLMPFTVWLEMLNRDWSVDHEWQDCHYLPQTDLIPSGAKIFRVEDGLEGVVAYLDDLAGEKGSDETIGHENSSRGKPRLTSKQVRLIERIYAADYEAFGYERQYPDA